MKWFAKFIRRVAEYLDPRKPSPWKAAAKKYRKNERILRRIVVLQNALQNLDREEETSAAVDKLSVIEKGWDALEHIRPAGIFGGRRGGDA